MTCANCGKKLENVPEYLLLSAKWICGECSNSPYRLNMVEFRCGEVELSEETEIRTVVAAVAA